MSNPIFTAAKRDQFGSKATRRYRDAGQIPVTIATNGGESQHLLVSTGDAFALKRQTSHVVTLKVDGQDHQVLVKQVEIDALTDRPVHADLVAVTPEKVVTVDVRVTPNTKVDCPGLTAGGLLEQALRRVTIRCPAGLIPDHLIADLTGVKLGQTVYAESLQLPEGASLVTRPRAALLTIIKTRGMRRAEATSEEGGEGAE